MVKSVLRIVLIGNTGAGKSVSGNVILGRSVFRSEKGSEFVTKSCQEESSTIDGKNVLVFDTPDVFHKSGQEVDLEIKRFRDYIAEGPCVIVHVIRLDSRIEESLTFMEKYEELFGEECFGNGLILFTNGDQPDSNIDNWMNKYPNLLTALKKYGNRYHIISNSIHLECRDQAKELLLKIEATLTARAGNSTEEMEKTKVKNVQKEDSHLLERRILLLGKTGVGKSATGNTILGGEVFKSATGFSSVTRQCEKRSEVISKWVVTVVDTPDFFYNTDAAQTEDVSSEIKKSLSLCAPGVHALLLVFPVRTFTEQENDVVQVFQMAFGKAAAQHTIVVFTHGHDLLSTTIEELMVENENVRDLLCQCGGRYHVLNNQERNDLCQVTELLGKVDQMVSDNGGSLYTVDMFHEAEAMHKEKWDRMLMETEEEMNRGDGERNQREIRREKSRGKPTRKLVGMVVRITLGVVAGGCVGIIGGEVGVIAGAIAGILGAFAIAHTKCKRKDNKGTD